MTPLAASWPTKADLRALLAPHQPPCISLYEPTHRSYPKSTLIRSVQWDGRYQLLALTLAEPRLYEGTRDTLDPVDLGDAPLTIAAALGPELTEPYTKVTRGYGSGAA